MANPEHTTLIPSQAEPLPRLIEQAAMALAKATTPAEILDARDRANVAYTAAKMADRLGKMRQAHDEIMAACRKAMGDALLIEAQAQCRLADEYDSAQERGEVATHSPGNPQIVKKQNDLKQPATSAELGINRGQVFEARIIRDAEKADPGVIRRTVDERLKAGQAPTRADVKRATRKPTPRYSSPQPSIPEHPLPCPCPLCQERTENECIANCLRNVETAVEQGLRRLSPQKHEQLFAEVDAELDRLWDENVSRQEVEALKEPERS